MELVMRTATHDSFMSDFIANQQPVLTQGGWGVRGRRHVDNSDVFFFVFVPDFSDVSREKGSCFHFPILLPEKSWHEQISPSPRVPQTRSMAVIF